MDCDGQIYNITVPEVDTQLRGITETLLTVGVLPLIAILGVVSNGAFIFVVSRLQHMRTPTNHYLVGLAVADTLDVCSGVGVNLLLFLSSPVSEDQSGYGSRAGCMIASFITSSSYFTTLFLITLVSFEKFYAVCHPLRIARSKPGPRARRAIGCACVVAMLLSLTYLPTCGVMTKDCILWPPGRAYAHLPTSKIIYTAPHDWLDVYAVFSRTLPFFVTLLANFIFYARILRTMHRQVAALEAHGQANCGVGHSARNTLARMMVVTGVAYFVLLAPLEVTQLCFIVGFLRGEVYLLEDQPALILFEVTRVLSYLNSTINPFIYGFTNRKYRKAYKVAFRCRTTLNAE